MLQIYIYGANTQGWLDVSESTALSMESMSDIFDEDLTVGEFSLPVELPWTGKNRKLLGFTERLENFKTKNNYWRCDVYENGWPEMVSAKLTILEKSGVFSYRRGAFNATIAGTKGLFFSLIKNKKMPQLNLGGTITWEEANSRQFAEAHMKGATPQYQHIAFAPVAIENFFNTQRNDYDGEFLVKDTVNNIIVTGSTDNDWTFDRPDPDNPAQAVPENSVLARNYRTVPFINLKYVLTKVFEEHGFKVTGEFIDSADFNDLYIFNQYSLENYKSYFTGDSNRVINPKNHVPNILIKDWLVGFCNTFCLFPRFLNKNEVRLIYRKSHLRNRQVVGISEHCAEEFSSTFQNPDDGTGHTLQFEFDSNDSYPSDRIKDLKDKNMVATVAHWGALFTLDIGRQLTTDDIAFVVADNMYYQVADGTPGNLKWDVWSEALGEYISGDGERSQQLSMAPLCTYVQFNETSGIYERINMAAASMNGSYVNNKGVRITHDFGNRIFYIRKIYQIVGGNVNLPTSFVHNSGRQGGKIVPYSLALTGTDGLVANFHSGWQMLKDKMEVVKTTMHINQKVLQEMNTASMLEINNTLFLPYKTERTIPGMGLMDIQLVPV